MTAWVTLPSLSHALIPALMFQISQWVTPKTSYFQPHILIKTQPRFFHITPHSPDSCVALRPAVYHPRPGNEKSSSSKFLAQVHLVVIIKSTEARTGVSNAYWGSLRVIPAMQVLQAFPAESITFKSLRIT